VPLAVFKKHDRAEIKRLFDAMHELRYGTSAPQERAEIVSLRSTVTGIMRKPAQATIRAGQRKPPAAAFTGKRPVFFGAGFVPTPTFRRAALLAGNRIRGRGVMGAPPSTAVLMPGDACDVDAYGNLVIAVGGAR